MVSTKQSEFLKMMGLRLRAARLEREESQENFAFRVGVSVPTLRKMEQGSPQVSIGTWVGALEILGRLDDLDAILAPRKSLAERYVTEQKIKGRQRAPRRSNND